MRRMLNENEINELEHANPLCADCGAADPDWASVSHGIVICLQCAGKHRGLGVAMSVVKSLVLDDWTDEELNMMRKGGNRQLIAYFKASFVKYTLASNNQTHRFQDLTVKEKYESNTGEAYRQNLRDAVAGVDNCSDRPPAYLPSASAAQFNFRNATAKVHPVSHYTYTPPKRSCFDHYCACLGLQQRGTI